MRLWWSFDFFFILFLHTIIFSIIVWNWNKNIYIRPITRARTQANSRSIKMCANRHKLNNDIILNSYSYILGLTFICSLYWYNWSHTDTKLQICITNTTWFYIFNLNLLMLLIWKIYKIVIAKIIVSPEALSATLILFFLFSLYLIINNLFLLIFIFEIQGIIFIYFIAQHQKILKTQKYKSITTNLLQRIQIWHSNMLFIQFWTNFFGAVILILCVIQLCDLYGILNWYDLSTILQLQFFINCRTNYKICGLLLFLILGFLLKLGLVPFHFWKPELYNNFSYTNMFIYSTLYMFSFVYLFTYILNTNLINVHTTILTPFWWITIFSLYVLLGMLFYITKIKVFLAYTTAAHITYIFSAIFMTYPQFDKLILYIFIYIFISIHLFVVIFLLTKSTLQYLSDVQFLSHLPFILTQLIFVILAMAGLPPFIGFWAKIYIILNLWHNAEYILALHILFCSLTLMYFYFYSYRYTNLINTKVKPLQLQILDNPFLIHLSFFFILANIGSIFFINDILNWALLTFNLY